MPAIFEVITPSLNSVSSPINGIHIGTQSPVQVGPAWWLRLALSSRLVVMTSLLLNISNISLLILLGGPIRWSKE